MAGWWVGQLWMMGRPTLWHGWNPTPIDRLCGCFSLDFWSFTSFHNCFHRPCPIVLDDGAGTFRGAQLTLPTALSPFRPLREPWLLTLYITKKASIEWYSFIHRQCHVTPPTPNTPKKKLTLTFCHQISLLLKKTNETPAFSGVTYLSTSATQRCHKKWTKSQVQQLWIHHIHTMLLTTRPNFLPDEKQRVFPMSDLGAVGLPGPGTVKLVIIEIHIFFSNHPAVCGRVEFPPIPPPHLELYDMFHWENFGIHAKTSLIPIHTAHDQYFMFMLGLDYLLKQPYFKRRSSPRGLYVPHLKAIYNGASRGFLKSVICPPPPPHHLQIFSRVVHPKIFKVQLAGFRWFLHVNVPIPAGKPQNFSKSRVEVGK